jgi:Ca2+-transporting ATPase
MQQKPRPFTNTFLSWKELRISIWQGIFITIGTLGIYQFAVAKGYNEETTRTMVFTTLLMANIFLSLVNRSFYYSVYTTFHYKNFLLVAMVFVTFLMLIIMLYVSPVIHFFKFQHPGIRQLLLCALVGFLSVIWVELYKYLRRRKNKFIS